MLRPCDAGEPHDCIVIRRGRGDFAGDSFAPENGVEVVRILGAQTLIIGFRLAEFIGGLSDAAEEKKRGPGVRIVGIALGLFTQQRYAIRLIGEICVPGDSPVAKSGGGVGRKAGSLSRV